MSTMNSSTEEPVAVDASLYPFEARIGLLCVWTLVSILGLVGNSLVILSVILSKKLRTVTNAFVVNLGVADFWTSLCYPWSSIALLSHEVWPLGSEVPCHIAAVQFYTGLGASLYSLASIALNRMVLITQPMATYRWWYTPRKVAVMIAVTWIIPCIVVFLPPIIGIGALGYDPQDNTCSDKDGHPRGPEYNLAQSLGLYPVPMLIIICSYTALYIHLKRHFRKLKKKDTMQGTRSSPDKAIAESTISLSVVVAASSEETNVSRNPSINSPSTTEASVGEISYSFGVVSEDLSGSTILDGTVNNPLNGSVEQEASKELSLNVRSADGVNRVSTASSIQSKNTTSDPIARHRRAISRQQLAITKNLFLVFCIFTLLLSPYFISLAIPSSRKFALYGATITIFNSCVNPIIYAINHPQFKVVMRKIIRCRYSEIPEPSECLKSVLIRLRRT